MKTVGLKVLVVGLGKTGFAAADRLSELGADVTVTDKRNAEELGTQIALLDKKVITAVGGYDDIIGVMFDIVVPSPGVDWDSGLLQNFRNRGIKVISEIELAFRLAPSRWVAVTGTNGKTTTTSMVGDILKKAGIDCTVCGNIGNPAIGEDSIFDKDATVVAEVSSFQLEAVESFAPAVAAILNITPDHLDRHRSMENYTSIKSLIFLKQKTSDVCVLNMDDPVTASLAPAARSKVVGFSSKKSVDEGAFAEEGRIYITEKGERTLIGPVEDLKVEGQANIENALAACAISRAAGADAESIKRGLFEFKGMPHRMEPVAVIGSVRYINDSKGTNVSATVKAVTGIDKGVVLIVGGRDKDGDFAPLAEAIRNKRAKVILIGEAADKIASALGDYADVFRAADMADAVRKGASVSKPGDTVLLSPACASFDMYKNFEERGEIFSRAVAALNPGMGAVNA
ncbi:MAG: UDP-N-acetylmuramoyl-L-alanine--D-glutamate ligase [Nitrospinota bacterium]